MTEPISNWLDANPPHCPRCGEQAPTLDRPASMITREDDGSYACAACAHHYRWPQVIAHDPRRDRSHDA